MSGNIRGNGDAGTSDDSAGGRIIPATRRPDGTMRKEIRVRAGYIPQDEVEKYVARGSRPRNSGPELPPGMDPENAAAQMAAKKKATEKNKKRKEKKAAAAVAAAEASPSGLAPQRPEAAEAPQVESVTAAVASVRLDSKAGSTESAASNVHEDTVGAGDGDSGSAAEKQLRNLKKKIRQAEALQAAVATRGTPGTAQELEKISKLPAWREQASKLEKEVSPS